MYFFSSLEPVCCSMSCSNYCFLTCIQVSQEAGQVVWYSHLFQNFPQFIVIHTVKGFGIINKAGIEGVREQECLCSRPGPLALHLDLWYWRCQWAGPGLWSEVVCLWMILTFREMLPDSQAWGAAWPCSCLPWGAHRQGCQALAASWDTASPASSVEGAISARPAVLAALFACPGSDDIISRSTASYFSRGNSPPGSTSVQLLIPAVHALLPSLPRKQV